MGSFNLTNVSSYDLGAHTKWSLSAIRSLHIARAATVIMQRNSGSTWVVKI